MSPSDIGIFELLAAVFTLGFLFLVFFLWRFLRNVDLARPRMRDAARGLDGRERGAVQFRVQGTGAPSKNESLTPAGR